MQDRAPILGDLLEPIQFVVPDLDAGDRLLTRELRRRLKLLEAIGDDEDLQKMMLALCAKDTVFFFNNFLWTYDPRAADEGRPSYLPFVLWPRQEEAVRFQEAAIRERRETLWEKSRDSGMSYVCAGMALCYWRFRPGFKTTFCSNKLDMVDTLGDPDSIFEKIRIMLEKLPAWMLPRGFSWTADSMQARLINPENKNIIGGEGGKEAGRGGRSSWYVIDEAAYVEEALRVNRATSANTNARTWVSSPDGEDNFFATHRHNPRVSVFSFAWDHHPGRDEAWAAAKRELLTEPVFEAEYGMNYGAGSGGAVVERIWADACVELHRRHAAGFDTRPHATRTALDVGAGKSESVIAVRRGPVLLPLQAMRTPDTTSTAEWAVEICASHHGRTLIFDAVGVGYGVASTLRRLTEEQDEETGMLPVPFVGGQTPLEDADWEEGLSSHKKFVNIRAEAWWRMREACRRSYERLLFDRGEPAGVQHALEDCLMIPPGDPVLLRQMCAVTWKRAGERKIQLVAKKVMRSDGIASPDRGDGVAMTYYSAPVLDVAGIEVTDSALSVRGTSLGRYGEEDGLHAFADAAQGFMVSELGKTAGSWW